MDLTRIGSLAIAALVSTCIVVPQSSAAVDGSNAVISEVYGGGGNKGAHFTNDFIELYNPTDSPIDVTGWSVEYFSSKGNSGGKTSLSGSIPAGGYYLIQGGGGDAGEPLPAPDAEGGLNMSGSKGSVKLYDASGAEIDVVGYGAASISESSPAPSLSNTTSAQRDAAGTDTDDNAADFTNAAPTPKSAGGPGEDPTNPEPDPDPVEPGATVTIPEIQGTGAESPLKGQNVTTQGIVTAVWQGKKSLNGFTIQTPGTGKSAHPRLLRLFSSTQVEPASTQKLGIPSRSPAPSMSTTARPRWSSPRAPSSRLHSTPSPRLPSMPCLRATRPARSSSPCCSSPACTR